jgi:hypothetical protein
MATAPTTAPAADGTATSPIPKRIRWFVNSPSMMAASPFLRENRDVVSGVYYCCFPLYISGGTVCEGKHCKKNSFDVAGVNALRASNHTVHVALAGASGGLSCGPALRRKEALALELVKTATQLPQAPAYNTSTQMYDIQGYFLDWEFPTGNDMECWTPLWRYVAGVLHAHGLELGFDVDNSQYNLSNPVSQYEYLWNFTEQVYYADFLTNMGSYPLADAHTTVQLPVQWTGPADQKLKPIRCGGIYEWCGLEGTILAMKHVGAIAATGQLEPAIWLGDGCNASNNRTSNGWTPVAFHDFLAYLDEEGVRSVAVWTLPFIEMGPPTSNSSCTHWMLAALREWIKRPTLPSAIVLKLDDDAALHTNHDGTPFPGCGNGSRLMGNTARKLGTAVKNDDDNEAVRFFVAPDGSDAATGTKLAPFRTLYHAQNMARRVPSTGVKPRATIYLRAGVYSGPNNVPLEFTAADSGTVWESYQGEEVLVSGGVALPDSAFTPHPKMPGVLQANLTALGVSHSSLGIVGGNESTGTTLDSTGRYGRVGAFAELFYQGQAMQLARWPNMMPDDVVNYSHTAGGYGFNCSQKGFTCEGNCTGFSMPINTLSVSRLLKWKQEAKSRDPWLQGFFTWDFDQEFTKLTDVDATARGLIVGPGKEVCKPGARIAAVNLLAGLNHSFCYILSFILTVAF